MRTDSYSNRELSMLRLAHREAAKSLCAQRVGAVVVKGGAVVARSHNRDYNAPRNLEEHKVRMHASICAERRALAMLADDVAEGAVIYVARVRKDGSYGTSKPCSRCDAVMEAAGIKRAVYVD